MTRFAFSAAALAALAFATAASAGPIRQTGTFGGVDWEAESRIIGMTSTGTIASGGDARFLAAMPKYSGVVSLIMTYATGSFICSGTLLNDRHSILTAAHCVSDGAGTAGPLRTRAYFYDGADRDAIPHLDPAASMREVSNIFVNSAYTGEVIDQNDIAVLRFEDEAPTFASSYGLYGDANLKGDDFNVAGYGGRSTIGGSVGVNAGTGRLRQGDNTYDYAWGDSAFGGFFTDRNAAGENFFGTAEIEQSWVSDFDSGLAANDMSCRIAAAVGAPTGTGCDLGRGASEVGVAGGDSGGPQFIGDEIASVTSYGLTFGTSFGDCRAGLNSSCGEFSGYVPVALHLDFIRASMVSTPSSLALSALGLVVLGLRKRRQTAA
jgi:secreted trypsin-like serine protease